MFQGHSKNSDVCFNTDIIRAERKNWTLGNDVNLLNQLEAFSRGLIDRTCFLLRNIDNFDKDLKETRLKVKTLSNTFEAVSDTQFVENRVYDEEEDVLPRQKDKENEAPLMLDVNEKLNQALKTCSKVLETKFEAISIPLSDSDDDNDVGYNSEVIFIPKNKYKARPLPHLIGGEDFFRDDSLGLLVNQNASEEMNNIMNGDDETVSHSDDETSSIDEPDESSIAPEYNGSKLYDNGIGSISDSKDNSDYFSDIKETPRKETNSSQTIDVAVPGKNPEIIHSSPENAESSTSSSDFQNDLVSSDLQNRSTVGANMLSSVHDELKQLFNSENIGEKIPKLKVFEKPQNVSCQPQNTSNMSIKPHHHPELPDDSLLPSVQTEILHSFAKDRAKIKGKRRLPSRKSKSIENETNADPYLNSDIKANPVLSPSTDEEDIFVLPQTQATNETPASLLFMRSSLFSPGSSIEGNTSNLFTEELKKESNSENNSRKSHFDEPLGIFNDNSPEPEQQRNRQLFNDWDPFDSEDSVLFPSIEKRNQKTKLFDELTESSDSKDSNDLFSGISSISNSLFEKSTSNHSSDSNVSPIHMKDNKNITVPKLFSDESDDEDDDDEDDGNIFSNTKLYKSPLLVSLDRRKNDTINPSNNSNLQNNETNRISRNKVYSSPLSESEDSLFD